MAKPNHFPAPLGCSCPGDTLLCLERQKDEREERREECINKNHLVDHDQVKFHLPGLLQRWCLVHEEELHFASPWTCRLRW